MTNEILKLGTTFGRVGILEHTFLLLPVDVLGNPIAFSPLRDHVQALLKVYRTKTIFQ
jgi:hypothetical protein